MGLGAVYLDTAANPGELMLSNVNFTGSNGSPPLTTINDPVYFMLTGNFFNQAPVLAALGTNHIWRFSNNSFLADAQYGAGATLNLFGVTYSVLSGLSPSNGALEYCSDCAIVNPCTGSGTGALAKRLNGAWVCN